MRVLCAGHVNWDVTLEVDELPAPDGEARLYDRRAAGGGSAANVAAVLAGLGVRVGLLGSVGTDRPGRRARRELVDAGVDVSPLVETDLGTARKYLLVDPDGELAVVGDDRGNEAYDAGDAPDLTGVEHVHLTGQRPATAAALADRARSAGATVSVDPGRRAGDRDYAPVLARADYLFVTDREADALGLDADDPTDRRPAGVDAPDGPDAHDRPGTGTGSGAGTGPGAADGDAGTGPVGDDGASDGDGGPDADAGPDAAPVVVVKRGAEGAELRAAPGPVRHAGYDVDAVDTAGAGDAFAAGFLAVALTGWNPVPVPASGDGDGDGDGSDGGNGGHGNDGDGDDGADGADGDAPPAPAAGGARYPLPGGAATGDRRTPERALRVANACGAIAARGPGARTRIARRDVERFLGRRPD